jgi:hypothetical protein
MAKTKARKTKPAPGGPTPSAPVTVRMFCQGLGDCFLISLPQADAPPYSILIDCGVAMGTPKAETIMPAVVKKISALTGGTVDLLVVTHEHWDHVSGFIQAAAQMTAGPSAPGKLAFKHLWWAWTEDAQDPLARDLKQKYAKARLAVSRAFRLGAGLAGDPASRQQLAALEGALAFHGPAALLAASKAGGVADAMQKPRQLVGADTNPKRMDCLLPGKQWPLPGEALSGLAAGVRAYVLGPPRASAKLTDIDPSKSDPETYDRQFPAAAGAAAADGLGVSWAWMAAALSADRGPAAADTDPATLDAAKPFDAKFGLDFKSAAKAPFFQERYFADTPVNGGRRIDGDWLWQGAQRLALRLEKYTNNSSLVLAFELPNSKKVLLFAADAQVGNWLSWHDQEYPADDGRKVTAADLLARTVLYKVGHHGSHNATLRQKGLELMNHPDLVAMLPVEAEAVQRLRYGEMPLENLVATLKAKTQDRILRLDEDWPAGRAPGIWPPNLTAPVLSDEKLDVLTRGKPAQRPLFMAIAIRDE